MSHPQSLSIHALPEGLSARPDPERRISGNPEFTSWPLGSRLIDSGVWMATPGEHAMARDDKTLEHFYILEGEIELHDNRRDVTTRYGAGELVVIEPNFQGIWRTLSTVKKIYFTVDFEAVRQHAIAPA